ncbi:Metal-dependent hydrolase, endonuclease/exonuclease/phosphatase family [Faunimonas pinastri]|uniref:Metal-dependent hydrolase, endonuclease/exonuclease/phosphatase family n=1 Tax=Faunimonas pinastri TaxID=1855383 RepID=A0A1H9A2R0_9HYPH|nr:endonuclease/exonuclease/phosphatase family protein [Faunimonas pinastri]SEP70970.1 Metal-dependent hydrolase, endonuclease/exonuclease/phosphatase family [Faunimonas pinastri]
MTDDRFPAPDTLRLMTWNIHAGIGPDGVRDLARIVALIRRHDPDIVALQEVDSRHDAPGEEPAFAFLKRSLGLHAVEARAITVPDGDYGHMLISRFPVCGMQVHDISIARREPRRAIEARVDTPQGPLTVVAVHLGLKLRERRQQAERLADMVRRAEGPVAMLGDFNEWQGLGAVRRLAAAGLPERTHHRTFPASRPMLKLDRIFARPAGLLVSTRTDPAGRGASDHLPLIADIRLPGAARPGRPPDGRA